MAVVAPLPALRPRPELAAEVASVPYDVVSTEEAAALAEGNPHSFLHVTRPEIDLPAEVDPHSERVYEAGAATLARFVADGTLLRDPEPSLYVYRLRVDGHSQTGVMGCCSVAEYDADRIKKHETTRPDKEDDRTRHLLTLSCHPEPVFLTYRAEGGVDRRVEDATADEPLYRFTAEDGVEHAVWRLSGSDAAALSVAFEPVEALYVADGHHRSAAASRAARARREEAAAEGAGTRRPWERFLAVVFPHDQVRILAYNRVVRDLNGLTPEALLERLGSALAEVVPDADPTPPGRGRFSLYLDGRWYGLAAPHELVETDDPVASLDAAILQSRVLAPILGIDDPRTSERIDFVGGIRGTGELERRVEEGGGVAFSLHPLDVEALMAVSDAGRVLPPKSTWFEPKLRSGLLVHEI